MRSGRKLGHLPRFEGERTRPRVVIENVDGAERFLEERILDEAGFDVAGCGGPGELGRGPCPLVTAGSCGAISEADVVVTSFRVDDPAGAEIIAAIRERYPSTPLIVEAPPAAVERGAESLAGAHVVFPLTSRSLVDAVAHLLGGEAD